MGLSVKRLSDEQPAQTDIHQYGPVAVIPIQGQKPVFSGFLFGGFSFQVFKFIVRSLSVAVRNQVIHEPQEDISDSGLSGFDTVIIREHRTVDDTAHSRYIGQAFLPRKDHDITGARSQDFDQSPFFNSGTDRSHMGIKSADSYGNPWIQAEFLRPFLGELSSQPVRRHRFLVQPVTEFSQLRID